MMSRKSTILDAISIPKPCPSEWDSMTGNRRKRFCQECNKQVYNLSAMTRDEAEALVARFEGRLCARLERDADGVILDDDLCAAPQLISRRASPVAAAFVTVLVGLSGNVLAITSNPSAPAAIHARSERDDPAPQGGTATLSGVLTDSAGATVAKAKVTLLSEPTGEQRTTFSDAGGEFNFAALAEGVYTLKVEAAGFMILQAANKEIRAGEAARLDITLANTIVGVRVTATSGIAARMPEPLRALHQESNLIVVARLGRSTSVKNTATNEMMKTTLEVTLLIKGGNRGSRVNVYNWGWGEDQQFPGGLKTGDTALFFLKPREQGDGYEVSDYSYGVKRLAPADLQVYLQRLEELNVMARTKPQDTAAIVDWLVRCAEQRATRWEGAYELAQTAASDTDDQPGAEDGVEAEALMDKAEKIGQVAAGVAANPADGQAATEASTCAKSTDKARFGAMLSDEQKSRLKAALFNIAALNVDDMMLVTLVQHWKDERFVPFLLEQLRRVEASPPRMAEGIMKTLAEAMRDEEVKALAEDYSSNVSYANLDAQKKADSLATEAGEGAEAASEDSDEASDKAPDAATARQTRRAMLQRFIAFVEKKRAN
jgi:Carboxypeptidase regulatory-like domain